MLYAAQLPTLELLLPNGEIGKFVVQPYNDDLSLMLWEIEEHFELLRQLGDLLQAKSEGIVSLTPVVITAVGNDHSHCEWAWNFFVGINSEQLANSAEFFNLSVKGLTMLMKQPLFIGNEEELDSFVLNLTRPQEQVTEPAQTTAPKMVSVEEWLGRQVIRETHGVPSIMSGGVSPLRALIPMPQTRKMQEVYEKAFALGADPFRREEFSHQVTAIMHRLGLREVPDGPGSPAYRMYQHALNTFWQQPALV